MAHVIVLGALDLNDNGRIAWPDFLGWTVLLALMGAGVAVLTIFAMMLIVGLVRSATAAARRTAHAVQGRTSSAPGGDLRS